MSANSDFESVVICSRRVEQVVEGGKNISFSVLVVIGDYNGNIGYGHGNDREVSGARLKAIRNAKRNVLHIPMKERRTIPHDVLGKSGAGSVKLRTAPSGTGIISGNRMRQVFVLAGIHDLVAKSFGSSNPYNVIAATFDALGRLATPRSIAARRGLKVKDVIPYYLSHGKGEDAAAVEQEITE